MTCTDKIVLLTGERSVGKTYLCQQVVRQARKKGYSCAGVLSPALFADTEKVGINLVDVATGEERLLAVADDAPGDVRWGRYRFVPATLEWATNRLETATPCDLLILDELGPLELERGKGLVQALDVLNGGGFSMALVVVRPELVATLERRLEGKGTVVLEVTLQNREQLRGQIVSMLGEKGGAA